MSGVPKQGRIDWIDTAKGIGILLVIMGHSVQFGGLLHNVIFSFHMPLFFMLSGYVYKPKEDKVFIGNKFKTLIVPYIVFCILGMIVSVIIPSWRHNLSIKGIFSDLYLGNPTTLNVSSIWFLIALFVVSVIFNYIQKLNMKTQLIIVGLSFLLGVFISKYPAIMAIFPRDRLPINIDCCLVALLFFSAGYYCNGEMDKYLCNIKILAISSIMFIVAFPLNGRVNIHGLTFNNPILYLAEAISGTVILISVCYWVNTKYKKIKLLNYVNYVGRHSLVILGMQAILVRLYIVVVNYVNKTEYSLYFLPKRHQVISFISVSIVSIIVCVVVDKVKIIGRR